MQPCPSIRQDQELDDAQIGLLLGLPHLVGALVEPVLMLLGIPPAQQLIIGGGLVVVVSPADDRVLSQDLRMLLGRHPGFPASGAFVTLAQPLNDLTRLRAANDGSLDRSWLRWGT